jgi:SAM-dependent methyltransferase
MMAEQGPFNLLLADIERVDPKLAHTTRQLEASWTTAEVRDAELTEIVAGMLQRAIEDGLFSLPTMIEGFNTFAHDFHERQGDFLRSGSYRARDYEEVRRDVYANATFMRTVYYPALLFSYLGAPNYRHLLRHLDATLSLWRDEGVTRLLEVASGHAFLLLFALHRLPEAIGVGTDIAPAAGHFAEALRGVTGWASQRFRMLVTDVLDGGCPHPELGVKFDAAICCELLEHVPEPERFLRAIHSRLRDGGRLFLSAAVRMESVDHLTLFESTGQVAKLLADAGFSIVQDMSAPFVTRRPRDASHWQKLLGNPLVAATFVADCRKVA